MSIDRSNASRPVESAQRIGEVRRVDREAPSKQYGDKNDREGRGGAPGGQFGTSEEPHDIIELSPLPPAEDESTAPPFQRSLAPTPPETERHIDIKV